MIRPVLTFVRREPLRVNGILVVVLGWLALAKVPPEVVGGIGTIAGLLLGTSVRSAVVPIGSAVEAVRNAATDAASRAVEGVDSTIAGAVGDVGDEAFEIVTDAAQVAGTQVLVGLGVKAHRLV